MNKAELIERMAKDANISKAAAGIALNSFTECVVKALRKSNGKVRSFMKTEQPKRLRVEISSDTLGRLPADNQVCAADLKCLDCISKQCLWRLCLESCTATTRKEEKPEFRGKTVSWAGGIRAPKAKAAESNIRYFPCTGYRKERTNR